MSSQSEVYPINEHMRFQDTWFICCRGRKI